MRKRKRLLALVLSLIVFSCCLGENKFEQEKIAAYLNENLDAEHRALDLIGRMGLDEKIGQLWQANPEEFIVEGEIDAEKIREVIVDLGVGSFLSYAGEGLHELQRIAVEETRLGIPLLFGMDAIHGHALYPGAAVFPVPLALSSSWDPELLNRIGEATSSEMEATGVRWTFAPLMDVARDPRWGRIVETFGEDPYLVSELGTAMIKGLESEHTMACAKHFAAYSQTIGGRDYSPADISERTLEETFLPPFRSAVGGGVSTVMTAFNEIGGIPCTANEDLIRNKLKEEWEFNGFVVSDYNSIQMLYNTHFVAESPGEAAKLALTAGVDMEMVSRCYIDNLKNLVDSGVIDEKLIDEACFRILQKKFEIGLFEDPYGSIEKTVLNSEEHRSLALQAARESIVMLKNDGILPLENVESIAVIGPLADASQDQLGGWTGEQSEENVVTILEGLRNVAPDTTKIEYEKGCDAVGKINRKDIRKATSLARRSDVVVLAVGEPSNYSSEPNSRAFLGLPGEQKNLVEEIAKTGTPVIMILVNGRPLAIPDLIAVADGVIEAWFPGEEGGNAVAEILFGRVNPSGKLTVTFPRELGQVPIWYNHHLQKNWDHETYGKRYVDLEDTPLFPFGYGLSYTTFSYSNLGGRVDRDGIKIWYDLENTGEVPGTEITQIYIQDKRASVVIPDKKLCSFKRVDLNPGEKERVEIAIPFERISLMGRDMKKVVEPGEFEVLVGSSSSCIMLRGLFELADLIHIGQ